MENIIFIVAVSILSSLIFGRLAKFVKLPNVTGYLIAGLVFGPFVLDVVTPEWVEGFNIVSEMALGFIAFSIGTGFKLSYFKEVGLAPIIIAICESFGAIILIIITLILLGVSPVLAILLGAIAAATAPAQTIMVINQYKAKGPVTSMLLSVAALDDAVALIGFGFAATIVGVMVRHQGVSLIAVLQPLYEVGISFALGAAMSVLMWIMMRWFKKPRNRIGIMVGFIFGATWLANLIDASPLLTCMALGAVLTNIFDDIDSLTEISDVFTPPIYMLFFFISGAGFDIMALGSVGVIGIVYVVMRVVGKWGGAWLGARLSKSDKKIGRYLGPTLMPQAGVAIGLLMVAGRIIPEYASVIHTIILCSTFIYSIIGPSFAKSALVRAGEISLPEKDNVKKSNLYRLLRRGA